MYHLHNIAAARLEEVGLHKLSQTLDQDDEALQKFPKRENGDSLLLREDVMRTLVTNEGALWGASAPAVADVMIDIQHLTLSQVLRIRTHNLNSCHTNTTLSAPTGFHRNFLNAIDNSIYRLCGERAMESLGVTPIPESSGTTESGEVAEMTKLGQVFVRFFGAQTFIELAGALCKDSDPIPTLWAFDMNYCFSLEHRVAFVDCTRGTCSFDEPPAVRCWITRDWSQHGDLTITWDVKNVMLDGEPDKVQKEMDELMLQVKTIATLSNELLTEVSTALFHHQTVSARSIIPPLDGSPGKVLAKRRHVVETPLQTPMSKASTVNFMSSPETIEIESHVSFESVGSASSPERSRMKTFQSKSSKFSLFSSASKLSSDFGSEKHGSGERSSGRPGSPRLHGTTPSTIFRQTSSGTQLTVPHSERAISPLRKPSKINMDHKVCAGFQFFITSPKDRVSHIPQKRVLDLSLASPPPLIPRPAMPTSDAHSLPPPPILERALSPMQGGWHSGPRQGILGSGFEFCITSPVNTNSDGRSSNSGRRSTFTGSLSLGRIGTAPLSGVPLLGLSGAAGLGLPRDTTQAKDLSPIHGPDTNPREGTLGGGLMTYSVSSPSQNLRKVRRSNTCPPNLSLPAQALSRDIVPEESGNIACETSQNASAFLETPPLKPAALSPMHGTHVEGSKVFQYPSNYKVNVHSPMNKLCAGFSLPPLSRNSAGSYFRTPGFQLLRAPEELRGNLSPMHSGTPIGGPAVGIGGHSFGIFVRTPSYSFGRRASVQSSVHTNRQSGASDQSRATAPSSSDYSAQGPMLSAANVLAVPRYTPIGSIPLGSRSMTQHPTMGGTNFLAVQAASCAGISPMHHTPAGPMQLCVPGARESASGLLMPRANTLGVPAIAPGSSSVSFDRFATPTSATLASIPIHYGDTFGHAMRQVEYVVSDNQHMHASTPGMTAQNIHYHHHYHHAVPHNAAEQSAHHSSGHALAVPTADTGSSSVSLERFAPPTRNASQHGMFGNDMAYHVRTPSAVMNDLDKNVLHSSGHALAVPTADTGSSSVNLQRFAVPTHNLSPHGMFGNNMAYHVKSPSMIMQYPTQHALQFSTSGLTVPTAATGSSSVNLQSFTSPSNKSSPHGMFGSNMAYHVHTPSVDSHNSHHAAVKNAEQTAPYHTAPVLAVPAAATGSSSVNLQHFTSPTHASSRHALGDNVHVNVSTPSMTLMGAAERTTPSSSQNISLPKDSVCSVEDTAANPQEIEEGGEA
eukprot:GEMP01001372.1.p1 GENE.GEMP01001372.1~~GEMP01001372.1.p1  ORF type:complete len:1248 (+),score=237.04 GEMP01001372.1:257-4000(+)